MRIAICDDLAQEREKLKHQLSTVLKNDSDRKSTRLNSSHNNQSRMPSSA